MGLFCAFDMQTKEQRNDFLKKSYDNGLLLVGSGNVSVRFRPPLNLTTQHVDLGLELIAKSI
jgi:L-lysine 6-transaminase